MTQPEEIVLLDCHDRVIPRRGVDLVTDMLTKFQYFVLQWNEVLDVDDKDMDAKTADKEQPRLDGVTGVLGG